jgi:hypothetical protein
METAPAFRKVVRLDEYRQARQQRELPLFDRPAPIEHERFPTVRKLSDREVGHRARMLSHLQTKRP